MKKSILVSTLLLGASLTFALDLGSITKSVVDTVSTSNNTSNSSTSTNSNLDNATVSSGLKEALKTGVSFAVTQLGSNNGYLKESVIKTYIKYQEDISKKLSFKLILDYSHTTYHHNLDLKMDNSSSVGITLGLKYNI